MAREQASGEQRAGALFADALPHKFGLASMGPQTTMRSRGVRLRRAGSETVKEPMAHGMPVRPASAVPRPYSVQSDAFVFPSTKVEGPRAQSQLAPTRLDPMPGARTDKQSGPRQRCDLKDGTASCAHCSGSPFRRSHAPLAMASSADGGAAASARREAPRQQVSCRDAITLQQSRTTLSVNSEHSAHLGPGAGVQCCAVLPTPVVVVVVVGDLACGRASTTLQLSCGGGALAQ
ncbi:hypothetical protein BDU57DRAFT_529872 [Ampelomyces quisqualis]|uniref:Uncharacterized protein n=1 Tax=Ampelomyces quisqualis TaxID=50730 RepID=A0A6A5QQT1_AMPQU|nr:hypothetical protein BDU57DRAFT_529872 [Ampelomyces quisqualis]